MLNKYKSNSNSNSTNRERERESLSASRLSVFPKRYLDSILNSPKEREREIYFKNPHL
jgi:hypothetical protein